jgi:hypothetical protein
MRVITFSRNFQATHPRRGEPTFFPEKIIISLGLETKYISEQKFNWLNDFSLALDAPKHHTIRAGNRWKVGDFFSPRVWSGKPYASKQIEFAPPIQIKKVWPFEVDENGVPDVNGTYLDEDELDTLTQNDGLRYEDFNAWILQPCYLKGKPFSGQIICWNDTVNY